MQFERVHAGVVLTERHSFEGLDGLRGVAAFAVVLHHASNRLTSAPLAVDLFFALSGFVIDYAYRQRLVEGALSAVGFGLERLVRLYPLYLYGLLIAIIVQAVRTAAGEANWTWGLLAQCAGLELFFLPRFETFPPFRVFPLDTNFWSLFFEVLVNALYVLRRWAQRDIVIITLAGLGMFVGAAYIAHTPFLGWQTDRFVGGFPRALFSFFLGVGLQRAWAAGILPPIRVPFLALAVITFGLFVFAPAKQQTLYNFGFILIASPAIIGVAAMSSVETWMRPLARWLGRISYALYVVHFPLIDGLQAAYNLLLGRPVVAQTPIWLVFPIALTSVLVAHFSTRFFDEPVRAKLKPMVRRVSGGAKIQSPEESARATI